MVNDMKSNTYVNQSGNTANRIQPLTTGGENLLNLAERCEQASGPDRELDASIHLHLHPRLKRAGEPQEKLGGALTNGFVIIHAPAYTASLDAALTLVGDEPWKAEDHPLYGVSAVVGDEQGFSPVNVPALAVCAAALRARAAK